jgi:hypothetical protein
MKKEDLKKIEDSLSSGGEIRCLDMLKVEATINSESFELVDIKNRNYICRVYNLSDICEILKEVPELYNELYGYWIHALYRKSEIKEIYKSQENEYDLYYIVKKEIIESQQILKRYNYRYSEFHKQVYKTLENLYKQESIKHYSKNTNKKVKIICELIGGNFVEVLREDNLTPMYVRKEDLIYKRKSIF